MSKKTKIITQFQNNSDYKLLTEEEQEKMFYDLMSCDLEKKIR